MLITLEKPALSLRSKQPLQTITIFTNQLNRVSRTGIANHLLINKKLAIFEKSKNNLTVSSIHLVTAEPTKNLIVDLLLAEDRDLLQTKAIYPIILEVIIVPPKQCLSSLTKQLSLNEYFEVEKKIGEGSFAQIFIVREIHSKKVHCMKRINKMQCEKKGELSYIINEFIVLTKIACHEFVRLYYAFQDSQFVYFVIELCPFGDLFTEIQKKFQTITLRQKYLWFVQVCLGIARLHHNGFIYRDLKPENVLIDFEGNAKICDFGYACKIQPNSLVNQICGSYEYMPPEMVNREGYNHSFDLYCLGLFLYELLTGSNPFKGITPKTLQQINKRVIHYNPDLIPQEAAELIKALLQKDPKKRLGYENPSDLFKHKFFNKNKDIVLKAIQREALEHRNLTYQLNSLVPNQYSPPINRKTVLPEIEYNYLKPGFNIEERFGPRVMPS